MVVLLLAGFAVSSAGNLLTGLSWAVAAAFLVQAVRGLGIAGMDIAATTVLQRIVPPALLGRAFGSLYGAIGVAAALAYLLGGLLLDETTPRATLVIAGAGACWPPWPRRQRSGTPSQNRIRAPCRQIPARSLRVRPCRPGSHQTAARTVSRAKAPAGS